MSFISKKSGSCLGIDIGSSAIKCVELEGGLKSPKIISWGVEPLSSGVIEDGTIVKQDVVVEALTALLKRCRIKANKNVVIAVSSAHAITKVVAMDGSLSERDIEDQVEMEASHFVPYAIDDVNLDFSILGPTASNTENEQDVLIAACRTDIVDDYASVVQEVGLQPSVVDIDTYAIERLYLAQKGSSVKSSKSASVDVIFDVGVNVTKMSVFVGNEIVFNRQQKFGSSELVSLIRQEYGVNAEEALALVESESPPTDIEEKVYRPFMLSAANEFARALKFFYSSGKHKEITRVLFTGGVSGLPNFATELGNMMDVSAKGLISSSTFLVKGNKDTLMSKIGRLSVAAGLAMRGLQE